MTVSLRMPAVRFWPVLVIGLTLISGIYSAGTRVRRQGSQDERLFGDACGNCTVSNGYGFASFPGDCTCYYVCVLQRSDKLMPNAANDWISHKRCCPCETAWSQKLLTCVDYTSKLSDCFRMADSFNPCAGLTSGTHIPRGNPDRVAEEDMCSGYISCVNVGGEVQPRTDCCPEDQCYDSGSVAAIPCSTGACTGDCSNTDDCECEEEEADLHECPYVAVPGDIFAFMGRMNMVNFTCAPGTCWDDETCTCVYTNNTGYSACKPWLTMDFDMGEIKAVSGRGHDIWLEHMNASVVPSGALGSPFYARLNGNGQEINLAGVANAYFGNTFVMRFFFRVENNMTPDSDDYLQTLVTNCYDNSGNGYVDPTIDVCILRDGGTGNVKSVTTFVTFNRGWFMIGDTMVTATINLNVDLMVGSWYEYWLIYCGDDELMYNAILDDAGSIQQAKSFPVFGSKFIIDSQSGFVFGQSLEAFKGDYDGCLDEVLMYRCKPYSNPDFDTDFAAIQSYINSGP